MSMIYIRISLFTVIVGLGAIGISDEPNDVLDREGRINLIRGYASHLQMGATSEPGKPFEWRKQPLMYITNPTRSKAFGGLYLWTQSSRPKAIADIIIGMSDSTTRVNREFHSLSESPLTIADDGKEFWAPTVAGVRFRAFPGSDAPAAKTAARLRQIRTLANQFSILISQPGAKSEPLRLMPRPIYRYSAPESGVMDGAIIAFVQGTDPEALLLIEAKSNSGTQRWQYAIVRCTNWEVRARLNDEVVYDVLQVLRDEVDTSAAFYFKVSIVPR